MDRVEVGQLIARIEAACGKTRPRIMEVCGTHTVSLFRSGVKSLLPKELELISGPGCPVCVTSQGYIDAACELAMQDGVTVCTYGDMVRVPGRSGSLADMRAGGGRVQVVYSARNALQHALANPQERVVFLGIGFETTAPITAATILEAEQKDARNFFVLEGHKLAVPVMLALLSAGDVPIDGFLCPGHVSVIIGSDAYRPIVDMHHKACTIAGFEPIQMLKGIASLCEQVSAGRAQVENVYGVAVSAQGNVVARQWLDKVFEPASAVWRALGTIDASGLELRPQYKRFDAADQFGVEIGDDYEPAGCRCGDVIQGKANPAQCGLFATTCTPINPIGPCMVSSEGTCAAWYKYNRNAKTVGDTSEKR